MLSWIKYVAQIFIYMDIIYNILVHTLIFCDKYWKHQIKII